MLKCPHDRQVRMEEQQGMAIYKHKDGKECPYLNTFSVGNGTILRQIADNTKDASSLRSAFCNSKQVRQKLYRKMSKMDAEELTDAINTYLDPIPYGIYGELSVNFGQKIFNSIAHVKDILPQAHNYPKFGKFKVLDLMAAHEVEVAGPIYEEPKQPWRDSSVPFEKSLQTLDLLPKRT